MLNYMHNYWYEAFLLLVAAALVYIVGRGFAIYCVDIVLLRSHYSPSRTFFSVLSGSKRRFLDILALQIWL